MRKLLERLPGPINPDPLLSQTELTAAVLSLNQALQHLLVENARYLQFFEDNCLDLETTPHPEYINNPLIPPTAQAPPTTSSPKRKLTEDSPDSPPHEIVEIMDDTPAPMPSPALSHEL